MVIQILKKECRQYWVKKRKTRTSTDHISHPPSPLPSPSSPNLSKQSQNEDIPGTAAKKEDHLEIVGSNNNIFVPKDAVSCNKLRDTISAIDFEVTTDNQHVDSSIVTYKNVDLLMSFLLIALKSTFLLLLNNAAMLYYINFHTSARNWEEIQNGNNGKHETVVIKYLIQQIKTLANSKKKLNERLKNCICFQPVHKNILKNDEKVMFYTGIPKLSTFLNLRDFTYPFVECKINKET